MRIKLLFSDLDGTLVEHASDITKENIESTQRLFKNDIDTILVTGRHPDMTRSIHEKIDIDRPVIGCNGGIIKNLKNNEIIYVNELDGEKIKKAIEISKKFKIDWIIYEQNSILYDKMPPKSYKMPYLNDKLPEHLRANFIKLDKEEDAFKEGNKFLKILLLFDKNMAAIDEAANLLREIEDVVVLRSANAYLDVMPKGSTKGSAVKRYLEMLGYERSEIAAIGDAENDLDMIEYAQLGIAMGNSVEAVKKVASYVTSKQASGFSDATQYILKYNKE